VEDDGQGKRIAAHTLEFQKVTSFQVGFGHVAEIQPEDV
jgi:hypothetical protein